MTFDQQFQEWWRQHKNISVASMEGEEVARWIYWAGFKAATEQAAEIAQTFPSDNPALVVGYGLLASKIRRMGDGKP